MPLPDINTPPGELPAETFGTIFQTDHGMTSSGQWNPLPAAGKSITVQDVIYLTISMENEGDDRDLTIWAELQRFAGFYNKGTAGSIKRLVETFSQPVNPAWADWERSGYPRRPESPDVNLAIPGPGTPGAINNFNRERAKTGGGDYATDAQIDRRRRNILRMQAIFAGGESGREAWRGITSAARECVYTTVCGGHRIPDCMVGFDDFASYWNANIASTSVRRDLFSLSPEEINQELAQIRAGTRLNGKRRLARFRQGGNWFVYHSSGAWFAAPGYGTVYITGSMGDSRRGVSRTFTGGTRTRVPEGITSGGAASSTSGYSGTTTTSSITYDTWNIVNDDILRSNFQRYASNGITQLGDLSSGRRTRF